MGGMYVCMYHGMSVCMYHGMSLCMVLNGIDVFRCSIVHYLR